MQRKLMFIALTPALFGQFCGGPSVAPDALTVTDDLLATCSGYRDRGEIQLRLIDINDMATGPYPLDYPQTLDIAMTPCEGLHTFGEVHPACIPCEMALVDHVYGR